MVQNNFSPFAIIIKTFGLLTKPTKHNIDQSNQAKHIVKSIYFIIIIINIIINLIYQKIKLIDNIEFSAPLTGPGFLTSAVS